MKERESVERFIEGLVDENDRSDNPASASHGDREDLATLWRNLKKIEMPQPSAHSQQAFEDALQVYKHGNIESENQWSETKTVNFRLGSLAPWIGLAAIFLFGFFLGNSLLFNQGEREDIAALRNELKASRELVALSMLQQASATDRMRGALQCATIEEPSGAFIPALLKTVQTDSSVNVRLAALGALYPFAQSDPVITELRSLLHADEHSLVKVQVIDILATIGDRSSLPELSRLAGDDEVHPSVRERARQAIDQISAERTEATATRKKEGMLI